MLRRMPSVAPRSSPRDSSLYSADSEMRAARYSALFRRQSDGYTVHLVAPAAKAASQGETEICRHGRRSYYLNQLNFRHS